MLILENTATETSLNKSVGLPRQEVPRYDQDEKEIFLSSTSILFLQFCFQPLKTFRIRTLT